MITCAQLCCLKLVYSFAPTFTAVLFLGVVVLILYSYSLVYIMVLRKCVFLCQMGAFEQSTIFVADFLATDKCIHVPSTQCLQ